MLVAYCSSAGHQYHHVSCASQQSSDISCWNPQPIISEFLISSICQTSYVHWQATKSHFIVTDPKGAVQAVVTIAPGAGSIQVQSGSASRGFITLVDTAGHAMQASTGSSTKCSHRMPDLKSALARFQVHGVWARPDMPSSPEPCNNADMPHTIMQEALWCRGKFCLPPAIINSIEKTFFSWHQRKFKVSG
jgi:hypothetical protein